MALITCPDCQQQVSQSAPACSYCGRPAGVERPAVVERPAYGEPPPAYGARPGHGEQPAYGARPGYGEPPPAYGAQPGVVALITCPDCQQQVSQSAPACPYCGRPMRLPSWAPSPSVQRFEAERQNLNIAYGLYAGSFVVGPLAIASVIFCYGKRAAVRGTAAAAHYDWLIETFWTHFMGVVGGALLLVVMGVINAAGMFFLVLMALILFAFGYPIFRLVKGYMALSAGRGPDEGGQAVW